MQTVILVIHVLVSVGLIGLILLQQGKGADMGAAFGSGASSTVFGSQGSSSFLTRTTAILATIFFVTSLSLAYFSHSSARIASVTELSGSVISSEPTPAEPAPTAPAAPADMPTTPAQAPSDTPETK